jgi:hypothetical protein
VDHQLVVRPKFGDAFEPFDVSKEARGVGKIIVVEGDQCALCADVDLRDICTDRLALDFYQAQQVLRWAGERAEAVDHFCGECFDRIRAFGVFAYRVTDPAVFLREVVGTNGWYTTDEINGQLKRKLVSALADTIGESKIPVLDLVAQYMDLGDALRQRLTGWFQSNYGITLTDFVVENISVPPEVEKMMDKRSSMALAGDMNQYTQFQTANAIEEAAKRPGGGGAFLDAGLGLAMGGAMGAQLNRSQAATGPFNPQVGFGGAPAAPPPPAPPPLPVAFHYAGDDGTTVVLAANEVAVRVRANPNGRNLVWREGMANWTNAADVPDIAQHLRATPPPLPPPLPR